MPGKAGRRIFYCLRTYFLLCKSIQIKLELLRVLHNSCLFSPCTFSPHQSWKMTRNPVLSQVYQKKSPAKPRTARTQLSRCACIIFRQPLRQSEQLTWIWENIMTDMHARNGRLAWLLALAVDRDHDVATFGPRRPWLGSYQSAAWAAWMPVWNPVERGLPVAGQAGRATPIGCSGGRA